MTTWAVYNSQGQFFARFITYRRALAWAIRNGMEWTAQIVKEKGGQNDKIRICN